MFWKNITNHLVKQEIEMLKGNRDKPGKEKRKPKKDKLPKK